MPRSLRRERWERNYEDEANQWSLTATMRDSVVAKFCDRMPLTLDDAAQLAETCGVPLSAAAIRLTEATFRVCPGTARCAVPVRQLTIGPPMCHDASHGSRAAVSTTKCASVPASRISCDDPLRVSLDQPARP